MMNFLTANNLMDMAGLDAKFASMMDVQMDIRDKSKPIERRLPVLKEHLEKYDIYLKFKDKKALSEAGQIRKSVYSILRQEQREQQPRRAQNVDR